MLERVREEATEAGCCRYGGTDREVLLFVWYTNDGRSFVQEPGTNVVILQQQSTRGEIEPTEGTGKVGTTGEAFREGGSG